MQDLLNRAFLPLCDLSSDGSKIMQLNQFIVFEFYI